MTEETLTPEEQHQADQKETLRITEAFLLGELIKAVADPFKKLATPWNSMSENEQSNFMIGIGGSAREAVHAAVLCIASGDRVNFRASVEKVEFKADGVKATVTLFNSPQAHSLADVAGGTIMIVIEDGQRYLNPGDALEGEPDQKPLFDANEEDGERKAA